MIINDFNFMGFDPSDEIRSAAYLALERILDRGPYGSHPVALLERLAATDGEQYRCAIEIYTRYGPFTARAERSDPKEALSSVERALVQKLQSWTERRFQAMRGSRLLQTA